MTTVKASRVGVFILNRGVAVPSVPPDRVADDQLSDFEKGLIAPYGQRLFHPFVVALYCSDGFFGFGSLTSSL